MESVGGPLAEREIIPRSDPRYKITGLVLSVSTDPQTIFPRSDFSEYGVEI